MDIPNIDNYPVYILNVGPELTTEGNIEIPQQISCNEPLPYNFYVPNNIEDDVTILNTECGVPNVSQMNNKLPTKKLLHEQTAQNTIINNDQSFELVVKFNILCT